MRRKISDMKHWTGGHDSTESFVIKQRFENREFGDSVLIGDSGQAVQRNLITSLLNTEIEAEQVFNESIIGMQNTVVKRSYEVWKRRFPILNRGIGTRYLLLRHKLSRVPCSTFSLQNLGNNCQESQKTRKTD